MINKWYKLYINKYTNTNQKKSGVSVLTDFRANNTIRDKNNNFIMTKESIHQGSIIILNIYVYHRRASKHIKQKINRNYKHRHISTLCVYICCIYVIYIYIYLCIYIQDYRHIYIYAHTIVQLEISTASS